MFVLPARFSLYWSWQDGVSVRLCDGGWRCVNVAAFLQGFISSFMEAPSFIEAICMSKTAHGLLFHVFIYSILDIRSCAKLPIYRHSSWADFCYQIIKCWLHVTLLSFIGANLRLFTFYIYLFKIAYQGDRYTSSTQDKCWTNCIYFSCISSTNDCFCQALKISWSKGECFCCRVGGGTRM